jgi:hypothetical protein
MKALYFPFISEKKAKNFAKRQGTHAIEMCTTDKDWYTNLGKWILTLDNVNVLSFHDTLSVYALTKTEYTNNLTA